MSNFAERDRFSLEEGKELLKEPTNTISHLLDNQDDTYSIMSHIVCEHCDYCDGDNEWWENQKNKGLNYQEICDLREKEPIIHLAKEDPYEQQKLECPENYGLTK